MNVVWVQVRHIVVLASGAWGAHAPSRATRLRLAAGDDARHRALHQARRRARVRLTRASTAAREGACAPPIAES